MRSEMRVPSETFRALHPSDLKAGADSSKRIALDRSARMRQGQPTRGTRSRRVCPASSFPSLRIPERRRRPAVQSCGCRSSRRRAAAPCLDQHSCRAPPACGPPLSARRPCPGAASDVGRRPALLLGGMIHLLIRHTSHHIKRVKTFSWVRDAAKVRTACDAFRRCRHHPAGKDQYFPFKRSKILEGAENPSRIVCGRGASVFETTMRPNPRRTAPSSARCAATPRRCPAAPRSSSTPPLLLITL